MLPGSRASSDSLSSAKSCSNQPSEAAILAWTLAAAVQCLKTATRLQIVLFYRPTLPEKRHHYPFAGHWLPSVTRLHTSQRLPRPAGEEHDLVLGTCNCKTCFVPNESVFQAAKKPHLASMYVSRWGLLAHQNGCQ